jgi:hypothetical protein
MTWNAFHHRGETLRTVVATADERRDGILPMHAPGVAENFTDELDLVSALLLKWHARLSGNIERAMMREPIDLARAVAGAWRETAEQMPGVRQILDRCTEFPDGPEMQAALVRAQQREWVRLAQAAGLANDASRTAMAAGQRVERVAREGLEVPAGADTESVVTQPAITEPATAEEPAVVDGNDSLVDRIKAVLAA